MPTELYFEAKKYNKILTKLELRPDFVATVFSKICNTKEAKSLRVSYGESIHSDLNI
jgi:hypothetical protein